MKTILLCLLLGGCATAPLPYCDAPTLLMVQNPDETIFVLDVDNARKLALMIRALEAGKCRIPDMPKDHL